MTIKRLFLTITSLTALSMSATLYAHQNTDYARVIHTEPVYEVQQRRHVTAPQQSRNNRQANTVIGGVIGAAIGHNISHNKQAGALIGGLIGATIAHDAKPRIHTNIRHQRTTPQRVLVGYNVTYQYYGKTHTKFMREYPGKRIAVNTRQPQNHHHNRHRS